MVFLKGSTSDEIIDLFHPSQLEQKYGGEAENCTKFWPPYEVSKEYGEDTSLYQENSTDAVLDQDMPPSELLNRSRQYMTNTNSSPAMARQAISHESIVLESRNMNGVNDTNTVREQIKPESPKNDNRNERVIADRTVQNRKKKGKS